VPAKGIYAALVALILGCRPRGDETPPRLTDAERATATGVETICAPYRDRIPNAYGFCILRNVGLVPTVEEMRKACADAGEWEKNCHGAWVTEQVRLHRYTNEELLAACGTAADCALQRLDAEPAADLWEQIGRCEEHAGEFAGDCAGHAIQRWAVAGPSPEEVAEVVRKPGKYEVQIGTFLGMIVACRHTVGCPDDDGLLARACQIGAQGYARDPSRCNGTLPLANPAQKPP
jgi:hypothetical protein